MLCRLKPYTPLLRSKSLVSNRSNVGGPRIQRRAPFASTAYRDRRCTCLPSSCAHIRAASSDATWPALGMVSHLVPFPPNILSPPLECLDFFASLKENISSNPAFWKITARHEKREAPPAPEVYPEFNNFINTFSRLFVKGKLHVNLPEEAGDRQPPSPQFSRANFKSKTAAGLPLTGGEAMVSDRVLLRAPGSASGQKTNCPKCRKSKQGRGVFRGAGL